MNDPDLEFLYIGDPMCSWCWGFAPVLDQLRDRYRIPLTTIVGGLRPGPDAQVLDVRLKDFLLEHWEHVAEASGQPFDREQLDARIGTWRYDTEPSCRAVVAMRELAPHETLRWFARLQRAFYAEGVDVTDLGAIPSLLEGFDVAPDRFTEVLHSDENRKATWRDFARSRNFGVAGFPTVLLRNGTEYAMVTRGFVPWEQLEPALTRWLQERLGTPAASALVCELEGDPC